MRILYCALDQVIPGTKGGSVHVRGVAEGLAALGHDVHALVTLAHVPPMGTDRGVRWRHLPPPLGRAGLRWTRGGAVSRLATQIEADAIIERYYNFGGEGMRAARRCRALAVLEVNAPIVDYPGSPKRALDRALLVEPMRRWREWQCRAADLIVTPAAQILPAFVPAQRILEIEWAADTSAFRPGAAGPVPFERTPGATLAVFAGAFRSWHGAVDLVRAIADLRARGRQDIHAVLIGDGPERPAAMDAARGVQGITFTGALPHERMPACLAAADIGVAPFAPSRHPSLALGFYWSPLKIFEYMAAGLPVVAPALPRLCQLVTSGREGVLYDPEQPRALADALVRVADAEERLALGRAARARAVAEYGWDAHCRRLDEAMRAASARRTSRLAC